MGDPIDCFVTDKHKDFYKVVDTYCWVSGTWTEKIHGEDQILGQAGKLGHLQGACDFENPEGNENCWRHAYYPWVGLTLAIQILFFIAPK